MSMKRFAFGAVFVFAFSSPTFAQDEDFGGEAETPPPAGETAETAEADAPPSVGETHAVKAGDTLWDLCAKYLNSPWYWPKIWSYNPQITNPHWIYPGNELRFYPSDENLPTNVEVSQATEVPDED